MPLPPPDPAPSGRAANPARILLDSPLAAATRGGVYQQHARSQPHERGRRVLAMAGALLVHLFFLFGFVLGPAFEPTLPPPPPELALQIRLIEPSEPPPPPPVRGTPPKEHGPRHQGRRSMPASRTEPSANTEAAVADAPPPVPAPVVIAQRTPARSPTSKPVATPPPSVSLPAPAPVPLPKPAPSAGEPPALAIQLPTPIVPAPPKFQPEPVSPPQVEGNRPILSPTSLALPKVSTPPAPLNLPVMAMHVDMPKTVAPISVTPAPRPPAAPEVPRLQPLPLPAQPSPIVIQQVPLQAPVVIAPKPVPQPQAPAITVGAIRIQMAQAEPSPVPPPAAPLPPARIDLSQLARAPAIQPSPPRLSISAPTTVANVVTPTPTPNPASEPTPVSKPASAEAAVPTQNSTAPSAPDSSSDASRAPDAIPQGRDDATVGEPAGVDNAPPTTATTNSGTSSAAPGAGKSTDKQGRLEGAGKIGGDQPSAMEGEQHGALGDYVQLKPSGDTQIMRHGAPNIGYTPTRFDKNWTPEGESSIDTALRHAVEKTTVKHIFHLPRGVRVECAIRPLLPVALFGCTNPDPPAVPLPAKIYQRLNLPPAQPLAPPKSAASTPVPPAPTPMIRFDNSAECAAARVAGGPLPPGCEPDSLPATQIHVPASSSSSWVPPSDQFH